MDVSSSAIAAVVAEGPVAEAGLDVGSRLDGGSKVPTVDIISLMVLSVTAYIAVISFPVLVDRFLAEGRASIQQVGRIAATEYLAMGVSSLVAARYMRFDRLRVKGVAAAIAIVAANALTLFASGDALLATRMLAGAGGGVLLAIQYSYLGRSARSEFLSGMLMTAVVVFTMALTYASSFAIMPRWGVNGVYIVIMFVSLIAAGAAMAGPDSLPGIDSLPDLAPQEVRSLKWRPVMGLMTVFFSMAYTNLVWIYFQPISEAAGVTAQGATHALTAALAFQAVGAMGGGWIAGKLPSRFVVLSMLAVASAECLSLIFLQISPTGFLVIAMLHGLIGSALLPLGVGALIEVDATRRSVDYFSVPVVAGSAFGPVASSFLVSDHNMTGGLALAAIFAAIGFLSMGMASFPKKPLPDPVSL